MIQIPSSKRHQASCANNVLANLNYSQQSEQAACENQDIKLIVEGELL